MKDELIRCILAFEEGIRDCHRPEDRLLVEKYLASLAPLLASVVQGVDVSERIQTMERLFGNSWVVDATPFRKAFESWEQVKVQHGKKIK